VLEHADAGVGDQGGGQEPGARGFGVRRGRQRLAFERGGARECQGAKAGDDRQAPSSREVC